MIKLINSDDKSEKTHKSLKKTKSIYIGLSNGSGLYTFATESVIDMIKSSFESKVKNFVSFKCYDAEYHEDGDLEIIPSEVMFWANEIYSIKILELMDAPYVEE